VGSLLEVGTGFHPELTGRENIYLNGAILGMRRTEIDRRFDEIVAFSEIERFLDTPVKRYSSGMYVRLAFAVAAHLDPEVLIVDEVLAVGDTAFQKKCLGKMGDVAGEGRTVIFVSHNMAAVRQLCPRSVLLEGGHIRVAGASEAVIRQYMSSPTGIGVDWRLPVDAQPEDVTIVELVVLDGKGHANGRIASDESYAVRVVVSARRVVRGARVHVRFTNQDGVAVLTSGNNDSAQAYSEIPVGRTDFCLRMPAGLLSPGSYSLTAACLVPGTRLIHVVDSQVGFEVAEMGESEMTRGSRLGVVRPRLEWTSSTELSPSACASASSLKDDGLPI